MFCSPALARGCWRLSVCGEGGEGPVVPPSSCSREERLARWKVETVGEPRGCSASGHAGRERERVVTGGMIIFVIIVCTIHNYTCRRLKIASFCSS